MQILGTASILNNNGGKLEIHHKGNIIYFLFSTFKKEDIEKNEVFKHINKFWESKSQSFQDAVFDCYRRFSDYYFQINDKNHLRIKLREEFKVLYALHPFNELRDWIVYKSGITLPDVKEVYEPDADRDYTPEKTYIRSEYIDLLTYALLLRLSVPIWSYYIRIIKGSDSAGTDLKEHKAFELLQLTELFDHPVKKKMEAYVAANNKKQVVRSGAIGILSPEDHPPLIVATFCVRKLCKSELQFREPKATLVSALFNFTRTSNNEGSFQDRYKDKGGRDGSGADDGGDGSNKLSVYERHRNSTTHSIEVAAEYESALLGPEIDILRLCPMLPKEDLQRCLETSKKLMQIDLLITTGMPCQKTILGWILSPILSPDGIQFQRPETIVQYLALAEALLWYRKFYFLSLLMTSHIPGDTLAHYVTTQPIRSRLSEENTLALKTLFPHVRIVQNRKSDPREESDIFEAIDDVSGEIGEYAWIATASESRLAFLQSSKSRRLNLIPEIRNELARLIITITDKTFYTA